MNYSQILQDLKKYKKSEEYKIKKINKESYPIYNLGNFNIKETERKIKFWKNLIKIESKNKIKLAKNLAKKNGVMFEKKDIEKEIYNLLKNLYWKKSLQIQEEIIKELKL